jgi:hypothetical protein
MDVQQEVRGSRGEIRARVAELADALDLGSSPLCRVGVRVPSLAPKRLSSPFPHRAATGPREGGADGAGERLCRHTLKR